MRLGIDFDNTIVCYDALFHRVALEDGTIPPTLPVNKSDVRNHLRAVGREDVWTEMQGRVYGARMAEADPFPGVLGFFRRCRAEGIPIHIVSHKTRRPYAGEPYDLHAAALDWLVRQGFFDPAGIGLPREHVFFELTKQAKLERIGACGCTHFIDDLPEFLAEASFPGGVTRILFDPNRLYGPEHPFPKLTAWTDAPALLGFPVASEGRAPASPHPAPQDAVGTRAARPPGDELAFVQAAALFLARCGVSTGATLESLPGGANNRVYAVQDSARRLVLKRYFHAAADPRDRFGAERAFYTWAVSQGSRRLPTPLGWDPDLRLGLFEWIDGRKLAPGEITPDQVGQAIDFVTELNGSRHLAAAQSLPIASEACFSITDHLQRVGSRVARLGQFTPSTPLDHEAARFVREELTPRWESVQDRILRAAGTDATRTLAPENRCLSPSDFGFHNALLPANGLLRFLDFEYAGWDDPAKLVCDFFCQPQVPVPVAQWPRVIEAVDQVLGWNGALARRADWLLPAYRLKWCCIMLNEFLGAGRARREFSQGDHALEDRKAVQLEKARRALAAI